jgi:hypothetical protein
MPGFQVTDITLIGNAPNPNDTLSIRKEHENGASVLSLARKYGIARGSIVRRIILAGGTIRGRSDANRIRMEREGVEGRKMLTKAAHDAVRGIKCTADELNRRAERRCRLIGHGERELFELLTSVGLPAEAQRPCGKYNIDIAVGPSIAVEVCSMGNFGVANAIRLRERTKYLRKCGYCTIFVLFSYRGPRGHKSLSAESVIGNAKDIISLVQCANCDPSIRGKDWMIRCSAYHFSRVRNDLGQLTAVETPVRFANVISELNF